MRAREFRQRGRSGTSAPSPSAPSFRASALSSSLSAIPGAKLMSPGGRSVTSATSGTSAPSRNQERIHEAASRRPVTRPAPVVVARPVAPAELPRMRRREDQPVMAQIVEETRSPHRQPTRAHNNTPASRSTQGQVRPGQSERNVGRGSIRVSASLVRTGSNPSESGHQPRPARGIDNASSATAQPKGASAARLEQVRQGAQLPPLLRTPNVHVPGVRRSLPSGASPSSRLPPQDTPERISTGSGRHVGGHGAAQPRVAPTVIDTQRLTPVWPGEMQSQNTHAGLIRANIAAQVSPGRRRGHAFLDNAERVH